MANIKDENIAAIALSYWLDGASLDKALASAQRKFQADNKNSAKNSEASSRAQADKLALLASATTNKIERANRESIRRSNADELSEQKRKNAQIIAEEKKKNAIIAADKKKDKGFSDGFTNFDNKIGTISAYGAAITIIGALKEALTFVITKTIEFEKTFTDLAVKSGYTNKELAELSVTIMEVAGSTKFSTMEIVEAATALGKLGFESKEVVDILPNVANVAGATGESLKMVAETFGTIMNAFSLAPEQTQYVADLLVDTFNNSALDMEKFNTAFSYVGAASASTGTSLTELAKAMAILSDRGVTASKIGTGLRNIFTELGREGDSLRDIIARVNEEQLSFYEIAELVGKRAANQLFILMDSIDEFDTAIADSRKSFGAAWEANALQMDTFSAKWDIFMNNITNKVAGLEFDPDQTFRASLTESIDLMTRLNALKLFNKDGADIAVFNQLAKNKENFQQMSDVREKILAGGFKGDDKELEKRILKSMIQTINNVTKEFNEKNISLKNVDTIEKLIRKRAQGEGAEELKNYIPMVQKIIEQRSLEIRGLTSLFRLSDDNGVIKALDQWDKGIKDNDLSIRIEAYTAKLTTLAEFIGTKNEDVVNSFNKAIRENDKDSSTAILKRLIDAGLADARKMEDLKYIQANSTLLTEDLKKLLHDKSRENALLSILKEGQNYKALALDLSGGTGQMGNVGKNSIKAFNKAVSDRQAWESDMCSKAKTDSSYQWVLRQAGVKCKESSGARKKADLFEKFNKNEKAATTYNEQKDLLTKQMDNLEDPVAIANKNKELIDLERTYRFALNKEYEDYLQRMINGKADYIANNKQYAEQYELNITNVQDAQTKDKSTGNINLNTLLNRDYEAKAKLYSEDYNKKNEYLAKMAELDLKMRGISKKDKKERAEIMSQKNAETIRYYEDAESDLRNHYTAIIAEIDRIAKANEDLPVGSRIDTIGLMRLVDNLQGQIAKLKAERDGKIDAGNESDKVDYDYFGISMQAYESVTSLMSQIGDAKLEIIKSQVEKELEVIQSRYDREAEIRNSALNSGIISQEQAFEAEQRANKRKIDAENKANKKLFDAQKKRDKEDAIFTGIASTAQAIAAIFAKHAGNPIAVGILTSISAAAIAASTAMNIKAISARKFIPQKYADGGIVDGKPHSQGGVPFTVKGRGGYEMEGGEFVVNKEATKEHLAELIRINGKTKANKRYLATGGVITADSTSDEINKAILDALSKPVRAYVTDQDLAKSESERRALTRKTSY